MIRLRDATAGDVDRSLRFVLEHGVNEWNDLSRDRLDAHLAGVRDGTTCAILALQGDELVGFASYTLGRVFARYELRGTAEEDHGHIVEAVVHSAAAGRGLGTRLVQACTQRLIARGVRSIYVLRHEQNAASAGMLRRAGFIELETYDDPAKRPTGTRRTTVSRYAAD